MKDFVEITVKTPMIVPAAVMGLASNRHVAEGGLVSVTKEYADLCVSEDKAEVTKSTPSKAKAKPAAKDKPGDA